MLLWSCLQQTRDLKNAAAGLVWTRDCRDVFQEVAIEPMEAFLPWDSIERCPRKSVLEVLKMPAYQQLIKFTRFVLHRITSSCQILSVWCFNVWICLVVSYPAVPSWNIHCHLSYSTRCEGLPCRPFITSTCLYTLWYFPIKNCDFP